MPAKSKKSKARKSRKPTAKKTSKPKVKKSAKPKKRVMAKKSKPKRRTATIAVQFNGSYGSSVDEISAMDGTLLIPNPGNSSQVLYTLSSDGSAYAVTPNFTGANSDLISFSFNKGGTPYSYTASTWTPSAGSSGGTWTGTAVGPNPDEKQGDWTAQT